MDPACNSTFGVVTVSYIAVAAVGIIGGYGGRAILQFALTRMFSDINVLEEDRQKYLKAAYQQRAEAQEGLKIIDQLNQHIETGLSNSELAELTMAIRKATASVRKQVFELAKNFRQVPSLSDIDKARIARTIPIFKALTEIEPDNHRYYAQLAYAYKDSGSSDVFEAIQYLDRAIEVRGEDVQKKFWKYELCRAISLIQQEHKRKGTYDFDRTTNDRIIADLLAVAKIYNLENILRAAEERNIPVPVWEWMRTNQKTLEAREDTKDLVVKLSGPFGAVKPGSPTKTSAEAADAADNSYEEWMIAVRDTWLKKLPDQTSVLSDDEKHFCPAGTKYPVESYEVAPNNHYIVRLGHGAGEWYIFDTDFDNHWNRSWEKKSASALVGKLQKDKVKKKKLKNTTDIPIVFDKPFPESQVSSPYKKYFNKIMGSLAVTGGFMEPSGHGYKSQYRKAIYRDGVLRTIKPGKYNIGFDYTKGFDSKVICMYSGVVTSAKIEGSYGYRIHIKLDFPFIYQGKEYTCYQAYAHNSKLLKTVNERVNQGDAIALEAGHNGRSPHGYGSHVDLDTYCFINGEKVHINFELLAGDLSTSDYIEKIDVLDDGSRGLDVRWLQQLLKIKVDGDYGPNTQEAVKAFQQKYADLKVDGIAGENTCKRLGLSGFAIYPKRGSAVLISALADSQGIQLPSGDGTLPLVAHSVEVADDENFWHVELMESLGNIDKGYLYKEDVEIVKGYDFPIKAPMIGGKRESIEGTSTPTLASQNSGVLSHWESVLKHCETNGCKRATSEPEGINQPGIEASHEIARRDMVHLNSERLNSISLVSKKFNVPRAIVAALASRESHLGSILGRGSNKPGWGDKNHGWGILQVDKRHHNLRGLDDPFSQPHVDQAIEIFSTYRDQISFKHPNWSDENVLKGACVAYNSGVKNVQSIVGMNDGTTHDDYGDDVIARAQFYLTALDSAE
jgi:murein DD-endopeptidase MepM/ murein hydrolase activator NlpD